MIDDVTSMVATLRDEGMVADRKWTSITGADAYACFATTCRSTSACSGGLPPSSYLIGGSPTKARQSDVRWRRFLK
jgi:hypothetical protein